jgi:hypothetical protein
MDDYLHPALADLPPKSRGLVRRVLIGEQTLRQVLISIKGAVPSASGPRLSSRCVRPFSTLKTNLTGWGRRPLGILTEDMKRVAREVASGSSLLMLMNQTLLDFKWT